MFDHPHYLSLSTEVKTATYKIRSWHSLCCVRNLCCRSCRHVWCLLSMPVYLVVPSSYVGLTGGGCYLVRGAASPYAFEGVICKHHMACRWPSGLECTLSSLPLQITDRWLYSEQGKIGRWPRFTYYVSGSKGRPSRSSAPKTRLEFPSPRLNHGRDDSAREAVYDFVHSVLGHRAKDSLTGDTTKFGSLHTVFDTFICYFGSEVLCLLLVK
jgi:hypothetical protein